MNDEAQGAIFWFLGGVGVFLIYCAVADYNPATLLGHFVNKSIPLKTFDGTAPSVGGSTGKGSSAAPDAGGGGGGGGVLYLNSDGTDASSALTTSTGAGSMLPGMSA